MSLPSAAVSILEDWYEEFKAEGLSDSDAEKKVWEKFESSE